MEVYLFDLLPYKENLDRYKVDGELPQLQKKHFNGEAAVESYREHLDAWVEVERLGFDGITVNEHHATPYGLMNSPNLLISAIAQRTSRMKLMTYGNVLPLHNPLRLAEELAMLDCLSNGRLVAGVVRGSPREYNLYGVPLAESRERFEETFEVIRRAWTEELFSFEGKHFNYKDVGIWPRPVQQPHPEIHVPVTSSRESIEWAARNDIPITPGSFPGKMRQDTIAHYAKCQAQFGRKVTPKHLTLQVDCYVADSKEQAVKEYLPHLQYFFKTLLLYGHVKQENQQGFYSNTSFSHLREGIKGTLADDNTVFTEWSEEKIRGYADIMAFGHPDEVVERIIAECEDAGANTVMLVCNRGSMPQELFLNQIDRIGREVLPRLQAHQVTTVKYAEGVEA